ncbi:MAG: type IV pilin protein [Pseudomonadota bacterium]|nr:type IV pilin protein [Pseudomonadota bacterium]
MKGLKRQSGFTLIELMVVVVVIAILASIAIPSYERHLIKSRRNAGAACLLEMAQFAERYHTTKMSYSGLNDAALPNTACRSELSGHYTFSFQGSPTATAYTLQAVPQGNQAVKDTSCGTLRITHTGAKSASGGGSNCF